MKITITIEADTQNEIIDKLEEELQRIKGLTPAQFIASTEIKEPLKTPLE